MKGFVLLLTLSIFWATGSAQILRVDKNHLETDSTGYHAINADVNFSLDNRSITPSQKLVYTRLSSRVDLLWVAKRQAYILVNSIEYFKSTNATPFSTGYTHFRINFRRKHTVSYETYAQVQYDGIRRMRLRTLAGAGIRVTLLDKKSVDVHFGTGLMYESEKWRGEENDPSSDFYKSMPKSSSYVGIEFDLSNNSVFTLWGLYQAGFDNQVDVYRNRLAGEAVLNFNITKRLTWINRFSYYYDDRPVIAINPAYFQLVNGLRIKF